jgi:Transposase DDE domain
MRHHLLKVFIGSSVRKSLLFEIFDQVMKHALRPLANEQEHADCFYKGLRLVSVDGTQFSAPNSKDILEKFKKSESRREEAAFAKIGVSVLLEIGTHHPIGAAIAKNQEGEITLTRRLLKLLPKKSLLIADRLLGVGALVEEVMEACQGESYFLIRARDNVKRKVV